MADANNAVPKKKWWEWLLKDVVISGIVAAGLDVAIKNFGPKALDKLSALLGDHITKKYIDDKRAEILDDFRKMETATPPINIDNLVQRHKKAIANLSEDRFVILLCKTIADQDPAKGRQATLKWLNDMDDAKFDQMLFLLDQDNHIQFFQRMRDRSARIMHNIRSGLKTCRSNVVQWLRTNLGALGNWIVTMVEMIFDAIGRFLTWLNSSWLRVAAVAVLTLPVMLLVVLVIRPIRRRFFSFLGINLVLGILGVTYLSLVQPAAGARILFVIVMSSAALICFWKSKGLRNLFVLLIVGLCTIWFLAVVQHFDEFSKKIQAVIAAEQEKEGARKPKPSPGQLMVIPAPPAPARPNPQPAPLAQQATPDVQAPLSERHSAETTTSISAVAPTDDVSGILPISGDEGQYLVKMKHCRYSGPGEVTCKGFVINRDESAWQMDVMDSTGTADNGDESRQFYVWRFGGSIQWCGGGGRALLIPGVKNSFCFTFAEPLGGVDKVSFALNLSGMDAINHRYDFANIPVATN